MWSARAGDRVCHPLDWEITSADALRLVRDDAHPAALIGGWADGSDIICADPVAVRSAPGTPWDVLDTPWPAGAPAPAPNGAGRPSFGGGWIGYLGFGLAGQVLPVPPAPGGPRQLPAWWFGYYDHVLRRDRTSGRWFFEALWTPERAADLDLRLQELCRRARAAGGGARDYGCGDFRLTPSAAEHKAAVGRAVEYIRRGDLFQANICLRLEAEFDGDPLDAFCRAVRQLDPPYAAFLRMSTGAVASLSPELFLRREGTAVLSRPIKGTQVRSADGREAARQRDELERSAKNRAENVMIVDLMRNDLNQVCVPGSVEVPRLVAAEPHPGVWHLVSDVRGVLSGGSGAGCGDGELVRAAFPPGSVTGAPKVRAVEVIHELEATPREIYTGAVGYRSPVAGLELNVAIRTFEFHDGRVWLGSGGGIVAASRPADEYRECLVKASPLIAALGGRIAAGATGAAAASRRSPSVQLRPRPAAGIFTSLRVSDGRTEHLADHLARLDGSARRLFGKGLPPSLRAELADCLGRRPSGRLRITVKPFGGPLRATVEVVPVDGRPPADRRPAAVELSPVVIPGGLGAHKWLDRRLLAHYAQAATSPGGQLLIEDADGTVLETDRANVFAVIGGVLRTPPADGRLLPGVTRAAVLRLAATEGIGTGVAPLTRADLTSASEVFVTNAVQGIMPIRSIAGTVLASTVLASTVLAGAGPLTARLAAALNARPPSQSVTPVPGRAGNGTVRAGRLRAAGSVVVIDNYDSFTHNLVHLLASAGCHVEVVRNDEVSAEQVMAFGPAGILISPGPCAPADAGISVDVVRGCGAAVPLLGVCLGHQAIAAAFGARIVRAPRPVHGQSSVIAHDGRGVLAGVPRRFRATRYHSLVVDEISLPPWLAVTARTRGGIPMGLRHADLPIEGVQFHPESILTTHGEQIIRNFAQATARDLAFAAG